MYMWVRLGATPRPSWGRLREGDSIRKVEIRVVSLGRTARDEVNEEENHGQVREL
jgi:hypothetical protein